MQSKRLDGLYTFAVNAPSMINLRLFALPGCTVAIGAIWLYYAIDWQALNLIFCKYWSEFLDLSIGFFITKCKDTFLDSFWLIFSIMLQRATYLGLQWFLCEPYSLQVNIAGLAGVAGWVLWLYKENINQGFYYIRSAFFIGIILQSCCALFELNFILYKRHQRFNENNFSLEILRDVIVYHEDRRWFLRFALESVIYITAAATGAYLAPLIHAKFTTWLYGCASPELLNHFGCGAIIATTIGQSIYQCITYLYDTMCIYQDGELYPH